MKDSKKTPTRRDTGDKVARSNKKRAATDTSAAPLVRGMQYHLAPRSVAVLFARTTDAPVLEESLSALNSKSD